MTMRRLTHTTTAGEAGQRLDALTGEWLRTALARPLSKSVVRRLIMSGSVRVNGRPTRRAGCLLTAGARIEASVDEGRLPPLPAAEPSMVEVLFEDDALIAVAKPAGLVVHATADRSRPDLFTLVRSHLAGAAAHHAPGVLPYLGLHQRLDRDTSGIVLFTKLPAANAGLARQFEAHQVEKVYHALTARPRKLVAAMWDVSNVLGQVGKGRESRVAAVSSGGSAATTKFRVLEDLAAALLVEARPQTGRKHQIRAHLAGQTSILGDVRYGGPSRVGQVVVRRSMLHARTLRVRHPITGVPLEIECDYPADFREVLEALRAAAPE